MRPPSIGRHAVAILLAILCAAPTVGDVGGCGEEPEELSSARYQSSRKRLDCDRCRECSIATARCRRACDPSQPSDALIPPTCRPLVRDAEVCLRALLDLSCEDFARAVDDRAPEAPSECVFCRVPPQAPTDASFVGDAR